MSWDIIKIKVGQILKTRKLHVKADFKFHKKIKTSYMSIRNRSIQRCISMNATRASNERTTPNPQMRCNILLIGVHIIHVSVARWNVDSPIVGSILVWLFCANGRYIKLRGQAIIQLIPSSADSDIPKRINEYTIDKADFSPFLIVKWECSVIPCQLNPNYKHR